MANIELFLAGFEAKHVASALKHFSEVIEEFQSQKWEKSIAKGGKFVEAVLKLLWVAAGETVPLGKEFKAGTIIDQLASKKATLSSDSLRLTVPRACRLIYDIASNRGGRHDSDELDPNEMDSSVVVANAQWVLAELIRVSQGGSTHVSEVGSRIRELTRRRYPLFEDIDGRLYTDVGEGAREVGLMILFFAGRRMSTETLIHSIERHNHKKTNARMAVGRLRQVVDDDGNGNLLLRGNGIREAEELLQGARASAQ